MRILGFRPTTSPPLEQSIHVSKSHDKPSALAKRPLRKRFLLLRGFHVCYNCFWTYVYFDCAQTLADLAGSAWDALFVARVHSEGRGMGRRGRD